MCQPIIQIHETFKTLACVSMDKRVTDQAGSAEPTTRNRSQYLLSASLARSVTSVHTLTLRSPQGASLARSVTSVHTLTLRSPQGAITITKLKRKPIRSQSRNSQSRLIPGSMGKFPKLISLTIVYYLTQQCSCIVFLFVSNILGLMYCLRLLFLQVLSLFEFYVVYKDIIFLSSFGLQTF